MTKKKMFAIGCLAPLALLVGSTLLVGALVMLTPAREPILKDDAIETKPAAGAPDDAPLRVDVQLEEGFFTIAPAPAASALRVNATYDETAYLLTVSDREHGRVDIAFRRKLGWLGSLARLKSGVSPPENRVTLHLPLDLPVDLRLHLRRGEAKIDLTGLSLAALDIDGAMGEFEVRVDQQNPIAMGRANLKTRMGEFRFAGLGRLNAEAIHYRGMMGDTDLDFAGSVGKTTVTVQLLMGSTAIHVPPSATLVVANRRAVMGEITESRPPVVETDFELPGLHAPASLTLDLAVKMGEITVE